MSELPRFVVIKSKHNGKYLTKLTKEESVAKGFSEMFVNFRGEDVTSPLVKFELEKAKTKPGWVHIRYCYNNKYLTMQSNYSWYFLASADQPSEDDEIDWKNTLFKLIKFDINGQEYFRFQHVTNRYACLSTWNKDYEYGLYANDTQLEDFDTFKVLDWESLVIFPKSTVSIRPASGQGWYLSNKEQPYLRVLKDAKIVDQWVPHEIYTVGDGDIRIKNLFTNQFWQSSSDGVIASSNDKTEKTSLFHPIKVSDNVVVLRNLATTKFLSVNNSGNDRDALFSIYESFFVDNTKFIVEEIITSRKIYNINFRQEDGRVYNLSVIEKSHTVVKNPEDVYKTLDLTFEFDETRSIGLRNNISLLSNVDTTLEVEYIPLIVNKDKIELSADEVTAVGQWGTIKTMETLTKTNCTVRVPPKTRTRVTLVVTQGMCEVPFSYTQKDSFYDGTSKITKMEDGLYTGINIFNLEIKTSPEIYCPN